MIALLEAIAARRGCGDVLAEGTRRAAARLGLGAEHFAMNVKGMEFAAWMPRRMRGIALTFATSNRGACHKRAPVGAELMGFMPMEATEGKAGGEGDPGQGQCHVHTGGVPLRGILPAPVTTLSPCSTLPPG